MAEKTADPSSLQGAGQQPSGQDHGISINLPPDHDGRPLPVKHMSAPANTNTYQSPIRHHHRAPSKSRGVKETLDAHSHYGSTDDASVHRINQYIIKQEIGRGSFGAVHLAVDQYGNEYAVKEFSKSRLRKREQSNLLRNPNGGRRPGHIAAGLGFNAPLHLGPSGRKDPKEANNSLSLIKEEIAIMKKLNHNNLVALIEVLDDPQEDSLYMVLEMCKKGVAMRVGLEERAEPYDDETCRCWFRDMILGIEYLHAQGIIHRDIKPDNCLITSDDVLKIVDFGVSEMFEKASDMATAKSAGSPAFMPPELCVAKHGQVSGRAADIWSMGVTLYCLRYGHIPFEKGSMLELYESIRGDDVPLDEEGDDNFRDLMRRMLEKDPNKRITMDEIRNHPWVTKNGTDTLLSSEENCSDLIEPPTEAEMERAITGNMAHLLAVMRAVKRFKKLVSDKHGRFMGSIFGGESVAPPKAMKRSRSQETHDRHPLDKILVTSGIHKDYDADDSKNVDGGTESMEKLELYQSPEVEVGNSLDREDGETSGHYKQRMEDVRHHREGEEPRLANRASTFPLDRPDRQRLADRSNIGQGNGKGHAHDPLEDRLFLNIGVDPEAQPAEADEEHPIVSESPPAVEMNIYEQAYQEEMQRILERRGKEPSMYLTRRVEHREDIRTSEVVKDAGKNLGRAAVGAAAKFGAASRQGGQDAGNAGRAAARDVVDKMAEAWKGGDGEGKSGVQPLAQAAKRAATMGWESAASAGQMAGAKISELSSKAGSGAKSGGSGVAGLSNVVAKAQEILKGKDSESAGETMTEGGAEPSAKSEQSAPSNTTLEQMKTATISATPDAKPEDDGKPALPSGLPLKSAFKGETAA